MVLNITLLMAKEYVLIQITVQEDGRLIAIKPSSEWIGWMSHRGLDLSHCTFVQW